ncbi:MAG: type II secretion system protein [Gammaproteobacteria bacterium]|nr:type II secretion system protein [Gammaproteobacteria bacterium]
MTRRSRGFTLIEITVVLIVFGVVLALAVSGLGRVYTCFETRSALQEVSNGIGALPLLAWALGEEGTLEELAARHLELPAGWSLAEVDAVYIRANGICSGGRVRLLTPQGERDLELAPPLCMVGGGG